MSAAALHSLLSQYRKDPRITQLQKHLAAPKQNTSFYINELAGSLTSIVLKLNLPNLFEHHLLLAPDEQSAQIYHAELVALEMPCYLLLPTATHEDNAQNPRGEILKILRSPLKDKKNACVIAPINELLSPTAQEQSLYKASHLIHTKKTYEFPELIAKLQKWDFEPVNKVEHIGTFSARGSIIDIFSARYQYPLRLSFWGNTLSRISLFDPATQHSFDETIPEAQLLAKPSIKWKRNVLLPLFRTLLPSTRLWILPMPPLSTLLTDKECLSWLQNHTPIVYLHHTTENNTSSPPSSTRNTLPFGTTKQKPRPFTDFSAIARKMKEKQAQGYTLYLSSSHNAHGQRLLHTLQQYDADIRLHVLALNFHMGFEDPKARIICYSEHILVQKLFQVLRTPAAPLPKQKTPPTHTIENIQHLAPGDYVVHIDHGIARFAGLHTLVHRNKSQEVIRLIYKNHDVLYVSLFSLHKVMRYSTSVHTAPPLSRLHDKRWGQRKTLFKQKLQKDAQALIKHYAERKTMRGIALKKDRSAEKTLIHSFIYEDTPDQTRATDSISQDMETPSPMDRLVCGDVGFGKTEIAIRAAYKAVKAQKQVLMLVPTTVLAMQHHHTFQERLKPFDIKVEVIHRFRTASEKKHIRQEIQQHRLPILIGTQAAIHQDLLFYDLGLLIIDEEQKLGVRMKDYFKQSHPHVDTLTLSATPIPRTLQFSLMGIRDISLLNTPPRNRQPIETLLHPHDTALIQSAIHYEIARKGQIFFVHNRIEDLVRTQEMLHRLVPKARIAMAHGKMKGTHLQQVMIQLLRHEIDLLLCTNIIENGLDIPLANTIIIDHAQQFGLADLHQLRGRVGRSDKKSYCYLLTPPPSRLKKESLQRLHALQSFSALGDGYKIALQDLELRGAGNLLGTEQSGMMHEIGFHAYHHILQEVIENIDPTHPRNTNSPLCLLETDIDLRIPKNYIPDDAQRLHFYQNIAYATHTQALHDIQNEMEDRFGPIQTEMEPLWLGARLRICAHDCRLNKISLLQKKETLVCYFIPHTSFNPTLEQMMRYVKANPHRCQWKQSPAMGELHIQNIHTLTQAIDCIAQFSSPSKKCLSHAHTNA